MPDAIDVAWRADNYSFKYRVAAIIRNKRPDTPVRPPSVDYTFLPGGKVRFGEATTAAILRELTEEIGIVFTDPKLNLIVENIYTGSDAALFHEVCMYYRLTWPQAVHGPSINEPRLRRTTISAGQAWIDWSSPGSNQRT